MLSAKPGKSVHFNLALSNAPLGQWSIEGELPEGLSFTNGVVMGTPSPAAAEKHPTGNYTNRVRLTSNSQSSSVEVVHHVKLSFSRNIFPERPNGPAFGAICVKCHGSGFPPDFTPNAITLLGERPENEGSFCPEPWRYVVPGDFNTSLIYRKIVEPPCGDRMPQGGPFFSEQQINRVARWIAELEAGEAD